MRIPMAMLVLGLAMAALTGCATPGRAYDDAKIATIRKDVTTEAELLECFGPANSRTLDRDGSKTLNWKFASRKAGSAGPSGTLQVRLGADGKVISYSASAAVK